MNNRNPVHPNRECIETAGSPVSIRFVLDGAVLANLSYVGLIAQIPQLSLIMQESYSNFRLEHFCPYFKWKMWSSWSSGNSVAWSLQAFVLVVLR